jgi:hypothetical protein
MSRRLSHAMVYQNRIRFKPRMDLHAYGPGKSVAVYGACRCIGSPLAGVDETDGDEQTRPHIVHETGDLRPHVAGGIKISGGCPSGLIFFIMRGKNIAKSTPAR